MCDSEKLKQDLSGAPLRWNTARQSVACAGPELSRTIGEVIGVQP